MPTRNLSAGITARLGDRVVYPALFFEGVFWSTSLQAEQTLNFWTGRGSFAWNAKTWLGAGNLLGFSAVQETDDVQAIGFTVTLNGQDSANVSLAKQGMRQNKNGKLWLALFKADGTLADTPYLLKRGMLNVAVIKNTGADAQITVTYESRLKDLERPRDYHYTHEDQQIFFPGDRGFEFVPSLQDMTIPWGKPVA